MKETELSLSIVVTLYKSESYIEMFLDKCLSALQKISCNNYEIIFVNDGSPDNSLEYLIQKKSKIPQIVILDLSRNFGHHYAAVAGLNYAQGNLIFLADCDLEVSPHVLKDFYKIMRAEKVDVVYGFQEQRKGTLFEKVSGHIFWKTINFLSDLDIPSNIVTERLMTRDYVKDLLRLGDKNLFLGGMMYWVGYNQIGIPVKKENRKERSSYSIIKRFRLMSEAVTSFSTFFLKILFYFGLLFCVMSSGWGGLLIIRKLMMPELYLSGYTSIMVALIFFFGFLEMSIGILGLYLGKVFKQVQLKLTQYGGQTRRFGR